MSEQTSLIRWLWERGFGRFTLAAFVLVWAFLMEPLTGTSVPEWMQMIAIGFAAFYSGSATTAAGAAIARASAQSNTSDSQK